MSGNTVLPNKNFMCFREPKKQFKIVADEQPKAAEKKAPVKKSNSLSKGKATPKKGKKATTGKSKVTPSNAKKGKKVAPALAKSRQSVKSIA